MVKRTTMEKEIMSLNPSARFVHTYKERQRVKTEREMLRWREIGHGWSASVVRVE